MESRTYYQILGVSKDASLEEITAAKNMLAKKFHPDANLKDGIDTTEQMQEILEAYRTLSDTKKRADYNRRTFGHHGTLQTYDLHEEVAQPQEETGFITYWKAANELYDIVVESDALFRQKEAQSRLTELAMQALKYILILREAQIPEKYWHPDIMNWLLFTWYKNRNLPTDYLLGLYDEYTKKQLSIRDKLKVQNNSMRFQHSMKRLVKY